MNVGQRHRLEKGYVKNNLSEGDVAVDIGINVSTNKRSKS